MRFDESRRRGEERGEEREVRREGDGQPHETNGRRAVDLGGRTGRCRASLLRSSSSKSERHTWTRANTSSKSTTFFVHPSDHCMRQLFDPSEKHVSGSQIGRIAAVIV